jgi:K+-sensing histidine kinase KdpD
LYVKKDNLKHSISEETMLPAKNILLPFDYAREDPSLLQNAVRISLYFKAKLHIVHVEEEGTKVQSADLQKAVEAMGMELQFHGIEVIYDVVTGEVGSAVAHYAQTNGIQLIVAGHKYHSRLMSGCMDASDGRIIDEVQVPVLILPKKAQTAL